MPALQVRLSEGEYGSVRERSAAVGMSMSEWVRGMLFDGEDPVPSGPRRPIPPRAPVNAEGSPVRKAPPLRAPLVRPPSQPRGLPVPKPPVRRKPFERLVTTGPAAEIHEIPDLEDLEDESPVPAHEKPRCPVCGWPLAEKVEDGCVPGNCSQRPVPVAQPLAPTESHRTEERAELAEAIAAMCSGDLKPADEEFDALLPTAREMDVILGKVNQGESDE